MIGKTGCYYRDCGKRIPKTAARVYRATSWHCGDCEYEHVMQRARLDNVTPIGSTRKAAQS